MKLKRLSANDAELVASINGFVFETMTYRKDVTSVSTTAAQAFGLRAGVCQDYAHVVIALARACGLAARYVSGHLLGEGGTHAWIEIILPSEDGEGAVAWPFDPTHNRRESLDYIAVAIGRDYSDVAPTSGTFEAPYNGALTCTKVVRRAA
jgi:transglutaminase-like putative cysteine protease